MVARLPRLLGRDHELARAGQHLAAAADGVSGLLVVHGEAGAGKTSLLNEGLAMARERGFTVLSAHASPGERAFPFGVVRQLFEPLLYAASEQEWDALCDGVADPAVRILRKETLENAEPGRQASFAELHGLYRLLINLAHRGPVLVMVDDLQWVDVPSLRWLSSLPFRIQGLPVAGLAGVCDGEPCDDDALLDELLSRSHEIRVGPLDPASTGELVATALRSAPAPEFVHACATATGANALLLSRLLALLADRGTEPTAEAVAVIEELDLRRLLPPLYARLRRASPHGLDLVRAAAVLDAPARLDHLAAVADLEASTAAVAVDRLSRMGLLHGNHDALVFAHPVLAAAVLQDMTEGGRALAHSRAAHLLRETAAPTEQVAFHLQRTQAVDAPWASDVLRTAARNALTAGAPEEAAAHLRRMLREPLDGPERGAALVELGNAELHVGFDPAVEYLRSGLEHLDNPLPRAEAAYQTARALWLTGCHDEGVRLLDSAVDGLGSRDPATTRRLRLSRIAHTAMRLSTVDRAVAELAELERAHPAEAPDEQPAPALAALLSCHESQLGHRAQTTVLLARRALDQSLLHDDNEPMVNAALIIALLRADELEVAWSHCDRGVHEARQRASPLMLAVTHAVRALVAHRTGRVPRALADAPAALGHCEELGLKPGEGLSVWALAALLDALVERGELSRAAEELDARGLAGPLPELLPFNDLLFSRGRLRVAAGDFRQGLDDLLLCGSRWAAWQAPSPAVAPWRSQAALACAALGDAATAHQLTCEETKLARQWGTPRVLGIALRGDGVVARGPAGLELLRESVGVLEGASAPLELARSLAELGAGLRRSGRRTEARGPLRRAAELARDCGADALVTRARDELRASGGRLRRTHRSGGGAGLTDAESRVAVRAAGGQTNRDIARELHVTKRTVEFHLTNVYRKAGVSRRSELAAALDL
ncbi:helix-turn-helix transcriptional regulator [Streptomyces sioyaensis]|uniref:helix-turn-helix transcriptional regulator n=1 Tax=Streptomyces sioyaensis TaxID=67364 RepID=UPI0037BA9D5D